MCRGGDGMSIDMTGNCGGVMSSRISSGMSGSLSSMRWRGTNRIRIRVSVGVRDSNRREYSRRVRDDTMCFLLADNSADIVLDILEAGVDALGEGQEAGFIDHIRSFFVMSFLMSDKRGP